MKVSTTRQANLTSRRKIAVPPRASFNAADNLKKITADFGILQHEKINKLHGKSFHSLCDNALALISSCKQFQITSDPIYLKYINRYLDFITSSQHADGVFHNKRNENSTSDSKEILEDANGYTIWALGYLTAMHGIIPDDMVQRAETMLQMGLVGMQTVESKRAVALIIKGLYFYNTYASSLAVSSLIKSLADRLSQMFLATATKEWQWFEHNIALGDSVLPEALHCAFLDTNEYIYKDIAKASFDFLLLKTFTEFPSASKKSRVKPARKTSDLVNIVLALGKFFGYYKENFYLSKINSAYSKFSDSHQFQAMQVA